jgi:penicillin-insensitive murein DD-endopeptidase
VTERTSVALVLLVAASCAGEPGRGAPPAGPTAGPSGDSPTSLEAAPGPELIGATPEASPEETKTAAQIEAEAEITALLASSPSASTSIGGPNDGRVENPVPFPRMGPGFRYNPRRRDEARFGTVEMVQALVRAAMVVHDELPGSELSVNDLGHREGGPIPQHGSHQSGRDVDVLFYLLDAAGNPIPGVGAPPDPAGEGVDFRDLAVAEDDVPVRIDVPRTFRFVRALLEDEGATVQRIFVAEHLRAMLLAHAREISAPATVISRFEDVTCQPGSPHDDHLHVRFFCTPEDIALGCHDENPMYPWQRLALREAGVSPVRARPRPNRPRAPTTSPEVARARAGAMHPLVTAWLEKREAWLRAPHPGRRYCR